MKNPPGSPSGPIGITALGTGINVMFSALVQSIMRRAKLRLPAPPAARDPSGLPGRRDRTSLILLLMVVALVVVAVIMTAIPSR